MQNNQQGGGSCATNSPAPPGVELPAGSQQNTRSVSQGGTSCAPEVTGWEIQPTAP